MIIKNATLVLETMSIKQDLAIHEGKIVKLADSIVANAQDEIIDASNCLVFPGFIDPHTHFDLDTGTCKTADDFESGTLSALVGGTTCIIDYATQEKHQSLKEAYDHWQTKAQKSSCNYHFHMAITDWNEDVEKECSIMKDLGITSFKLYMAYDNLRVNDEEILACLKAVKQLDGVVCVHCENGTLINYFTRQQKALQNYSPSAHPKSRMDLAEAEAISRLAYLAQIANAKINIVHLSSKAGLEAVRVARSRGVDIHVETCPQYLLLNDECYEAEGFEGAKYVMSPPLRKLADQEALLHAILDHEIDTIATDHCSFNYKHQKELGKFDFTKIPNGVGGVEQRGLLMYHLLVHEHSLSLHDFAAIMSTNAAKLYGLYPQKGVIALGSDADLVIIDPTKNTIIKAETQMSNADYTIYENMEVNAEIQAVFLNGQCVVKQQTVLKRNQGTYVHGK